MFDGLKLMSFLIAILMVHSLTPKPSTPMFPPQAIEANENYRDWYGPELVQFGEKPLWVESDDAAGRETIRFTFIPGATLLRGRHTTVIRIETEKGKARLIARTEINDRGKRSNREVANKSLSFAEVVKLQAFAEKAEPWKYPVGTWEKDEISIHCTELLMERRQRSSYAVSHILISCNQPDRLMPLVDYVAELAGQKRKDLRY